MNLKKLSDSASAGEWGVYDSFGTLEIGHAEKLGERPNIVGWAGFDSCDKPVPERRANARFIVALVNAYRAGKLVEAGQERGEAEQIIAWKVEGKNIDGMEQTWFYTPESPFVPAHREQGHKMTPLYSRSTSERSGDTRDDHK